MKLINQTYKLKTAPASEPISLSDLKKILKIEVSCTDDDDYLTSLIIAARQMVESYTNRALISQVWYMYQDYIGYTTEITRVPVISFAAYTYRDEDGTDQDLTAFTDVYTDVVGEPARIEVEDIPTIDDTGYNQFCIEFTAGYTTVPQPLIQAIIMMCGHWYENRQDVVTGTQVNEVPEASKYLMSQYIYSELR